MGKFINFSKIGFRGGQLDSIKFSEILNSVILYYESKTNEFGGNQASKTKDCIFSKTTPISNLIFKKNED